METYANCLTAAGLSAGEAVTFALPNIPESVYLLYAAAKAGLRIAPIHPLSSPDAIAAAMQRSGSRLAFVLADSAQNTAAAKHAVVMRRTNLDTESYTSGRS